MRASQIVLALILLVTNPAMPQTVGAGVGEKSLACAYNFANGGSTGLSWCVSTEGTLVKFASPPANEHIRTGVSAVEGYMICSNATPEAYDFSYTTNMGGSALLSGPTSTGVTVRRFPGAGAASRWRVDNQYKADPKENDVTITMTVKNVGSVTIPSVYIIRMYDPALDNDDSDEINDVSARSVWTRDAGFANAVALTGTTFGTNTIGTVHFPSIDCFPPTLATPTGPGDNWVRVTYSVGNVAPGATKKVVFTYRRQ